MEIKKRRRFGFEDLLLLVTGLTGFYFMLTNEVYSSKWVFGTSLITLSIALSGFFMVIKVVKVMKLITDYIKKKEENNGERTKTKKEI